MKSIFLTLSFFFLASVCSFAQTVEGFSYQKYPVENVYKGVKAKLKLNEYDIPEHERDWVLKEYKNGKVDFAGYYITLHWSGGTGLTLGAIADVRDGKLYSLPDDDGNSNNYCEKAIAGGKLSSRMYVTSYCNYDEQNAKPFYTVFVWNEIKKKFIQLSK